MKKITQTIIILFLTLTVTNAQQEKGINGVNNWLNNWTEFKTSQKDYGEPTQILTGNITKDTKLVKRDVYLLLGNVFVTNNATLTIEPGTVIIGDYKTKASLTIAKGSKIIADGTQTDPIIFTSGRSIKRAGDWGGLIVLGEAPTNKFGNGSVASFYHNLATSAYQSTNFGGENKEDNSGVLRYVRIEFAGKRVKDSGYFNGLLLACLGNQTVLENIMVSHAAGNAFEIWGGEINLSKAVSYRSSGNDFTFNYGTQCNISNSLAIRTPYVSSSEGARCIQAMSYTEENEVDFSRPGTAVNATNVTLLNDSEDVDADIEMGLVKEAVYVMQNTEFIMDRSVISGFNPAVLFEEKIKVNQVNLEKIRLTNMYFNNCKGNIFVDNKPNNEDLENWYGNTAFFNVYSKSTNTETFIDIYNKKRPDFRLRINKIIASNEFDD